MKAIVAQPTKDGFTAKRMLYVSSDIPVKFSPLDCRTFKTFDDANKAARFLAKEYNMSFVNMR